MPESSIFTRLFQSQRVHVSQTLLKSLPQHFHPDFPLTKDKLSQKTTLSVRSVISALFLNTLTPDHVYSRHNWENFPQHVQTRLSQKLETYSGIFMPFLKCTQTFAHFQKKDQVHSLNIFEVIESEKCGDFNARKLLF